jgi:hypothetical protein
MTAARRNESCVSDVVQSLVNETFTTIALIKFATQAFEDPVSSGRNPEHELIHRRIS